MEHKKSYINYSTLSILFLFCLLSFGETNSSKRDSLLKKKEYYLKMQDSLHTKKRETIKQVEKNVDKFTQKRFAIKNYKKEELIANLIYKLAYYYQGIEENEQIVTGEKLDALYNKYTDKFFSSDSLQARIEYMQEINKLAPSLKDQYDEQSLISEEPGGKYKGEYKKTLEYYKKIIDDYPTSNLAMNVYYNIAFILYDMGRKDEAVDIYKKIISNFPDSDYYIDALFALGEYYFDPDLNPTEDRDLDQYNVNIAMKYYQAMLDAGIDSNNSLYFKALYRLGFCYYRIYKYEKAVDYLTETVEKLYEKNGIQKLKAGMLELSIEFLAFTFKDNLWTDSDNTDNDYATIAQLKNYIMRRKKDNYNALNIYGPELFEKLAIAYKDGEDYNLAIASYDTLLSLYPLIKDAPDIQEKIIAIYEEKPYDDENQQQADLYKQRNKLFKNYNELTAWGKINDITRDSLDTDKKIAGFLFYNIRYAFDNKKYALAIKHIDEYMTLPNDSNTYKLKWWKAQIYNAKLHDFKNAYDMYFYISNDTLTKRVYDATNKVTYTDTMAATNAINVAQRILKENSTKVVQNIDTLSTKTQSADKLSQEQKMVIDAFKNYAYLFPTSKNAPSYLFNAAKIYHKKEVYAKNENLLNRIIKRYPQTLEERQSFNMLYDEYFKLKKFAKAEKIMKKMSSLADLSEKEKKEIIKKKGSAVFKIAETEYKEASTIDSSVVDSTGKIVIDFKAKFDKLKSAADNSMRTARENPDYEFADQSVWNAATYYGQAKEWDSVFVAYNYLMDHFKNKKNKSGIELATVASYKIAYLVADTLNKYTDYTGNLKTQFKNRNSQAALYLEEFNKQHPDFILSKQNVSQLAVNDAAYFYKLAENWEGSIRMNRIYIDKYGKTESEDAGVRRLRDVASTYMRIGEQKKAFGIYAELGKKYPDAPFAVEGYYQRAKYYLEKNDKEQAKSDFEECISRSRKLKQKGLKSFGSFYASEALLQLAEWERKEFEKMDLTGPSAKDIQSQLDEKSRKMVDLAMKYQEIIGYVSKEYSIALIRMAQITENFADALYNQKRINLESKIDYLAKEGGIDHAAEGAYTKSIELYSSAISEMDDFIKAWEVKNNNSIAEIDSLLKKDSTNVELLAKRRIVNSDSTVKVSVKLKEQAKKSVIRMQYTLASVSKDLAYQYTLINPEDFDMNNESLEFYEAKNALLDETSIAMVKKIIVAHQKTIQYAKKFDMLNDIWAQKSKIEIGKSSDIIINAYLRQSKKLINLYRITDNYIKELNRKSIFRDADGFAMVPKIKYNGEKSDITLFYEKMGTIVDYIGDALTKSLDNYSENFQAAKGNISKKYFDQLKLNYLDNTIKYTEEIDSLVTYSYHRQSQLTDLLNTSTDLNEVYVDNADEFIEAYKNQAENLTEKVNDLYDVAYEKIKEYNIRNKYTNTIFYKLLTKKTNDYYEEFGYSTLKQSIKSDFSWETISIEDKGWFKKNFVAKNWVSPDTVNYSEQIKNDSIFKANSVIPIWTHYNTKFDSLLKKEDIANTDEEDNPLKDKKIFYFRKTFKIGNIPVEGSIYLAVDDIFGFVINGEFIYDMILKEDKDAFDLYFDNDTDGWNKVRKWNIADYLKEGKNTITIYAIDSDNSKNGVSCYLDYQMLDKSVDKSKQFKTSEMQNISEEIAPEQKEIIRIFRKNKLK